MRLGILSILTDSQSHEQVQVPLQHGHMDIDATASTTLATSLPPHSHYASRNIGQRGESGERFSSLCRPLMNISIAAPSYTLPSSFNTPTWSENNWRGDYSPGPVPYGLAWHGHPGPKRQPSLPLPNNSTRKIGPTGQTISLISVAKHDTTFV
jgi:hypothetical protein